MIMRFKHFESEELRKYKGRIVFRGDCVKDEYGNHTIFQELSSSPTSIHSANSAIAYGLLPGHKTTTVDAIRAYVQTTLKSKHETWVHIPRDLQPKEWQGKWTKPMCRLYKALYGHPESGGHWENHLTESVRSLRGEPIWNHPSSFWFPGPKLMLSVYVDDLLLSGPSGAHAKFWEDLRFGSKPVNTEDPEPLERFLGRTHTPWTIAT